MQECKCVHYFCMFFALMFASLFGPLLLPTPSKTSSKKKHLKKKIKLNFNYVVNLAGYVDHSHKIKTIKSHFNGCKNISSLFINSKIEKFIDVA